MKTSLAAVALVCLVSAAQAAGPPLPSAAVVKIFEKPFPAEEDKRGRFLFDFAKEEELRQFESHKIPRNWRPIFEQFAASLVQKASEQRLDSPSLRKILELILQGPPEVADCMPVGAYQTTLERRPIWIVVLKRSNSYDEPATHFAVYAFEQRTLRRVGLVQCN